jgi:hypothetical protein
VRRPLKIISQRVVQVGERLAECLEELAELLVPYVAVATFEWAEKRPVDAILGREHFLGLAERFTPVANDMAKCH